MEDARRAQQGNVDADLRGGLFKQRIKRQGRGKSHGFRAILIKHSNGMFLLVDLFSKSNKQNLTDREVEVLRDLVKRYSSLSQAQVLDLAEKRQWRIIKDADP